MKKIERTDEIIQDKPIKFRVKGIFGIKFPFGIKPLRMRTIVRIAAQAEKIKENPATEALSAIGNSKGNAAPMCRTIAYSVLGGSLKISLFGRILSRFFEETLTPKEVSDLLQIVIKQSSPNELFFCTVLMKMIVPATLRAVELEEEKLSGEKSQE
jgi:hypothetical protein